MDANLSALRGSRPPYGRADLRLALCGLVVGAILATSCASFRRSFQADPQAPAPDKTMTVSGLRYEESTGRLFIDDMEADQLVCVHPRSASYQHTGTYCADVRDIQGYLLNQAMVTP